jgi:hypothetical protein
LNEANLERASDGEGQETGIEVDMDASDDKAVTRTPPSSKARPAGSAREQAWMDKSKDVQKRMSRMQRSFDQRMADQEASFQRQLGLQREEFLKARPTSDTAVDGDEVKHDAAMALLQEVLEAAQERGDSKAVAKATADMSTANAKFWSAKTQKMTGAPTKVTPAVQQKAPTQAGKRWTDANTEWWNDITDTDSASARGMANNLHAKFISEGSNPDTDEHYEKIRKLIAKRFPEVSTVTTFKKADPGDEDGGEDGGDANEGRRVVKANLPNRGTNQPRRNVQTLTKQDIATMRAVNLDPNSNKAVVEFLKQKNLIEDEA